MRSGWGQQLRSLSKTEIGHFVFSLGLAASGLTVSLIHASMADIADYKLMAAFVVAYAFVDAMHVRLARGDTVFVDGAIALASVLLLTPSEAVIACLLGVALGATFDLGSEKVLVVRLGEILRRPLLVAALAALASAPANREALVNGDMLALLWAIGLGLLHSVGDFSLVAIGMSLERRMGFWSIVRGLARSLAALYAAHISLGVVSALLFPSGRFWGFGLMVALVLLIQYSFNLLLKTKGAYDETIQALVRASELQSEDGDEGHSRRVADMCVYSGRLLGLSTKSLERLNYAALLHEIGRIGLSDGVDSSFVVTAHPHRGAEIVGGIPFLASTSGIIRSQSVDPVVESSALSDDDALCAQLIGVCCALDRHFGSDFGRRLNEASMSRGIETCAPRVDKRVREAVLRASIRGLRMQRRTV